jgi:putative CocE/NonD family hydrolase
VSGLDQTRIIIDKNVPSVMRDGTTLRADVYRPEGEGEYPVLLTRLPYNKDLPHYVNRFVDPVRVAMQGYAVIVQDVRGRFKSEGEFTSYDAEAEDGYDTVEWAAALPYSNGKVGMFGLSYYGFTQWLAAVECPPHLTAIFPSITFNDSRDGVMFQGGALQLALRESWTLGTMSADLLIRKHGMTPELAGSLNQLAGHMNKFSEWFNYAPIKEWPPLKELDVASFFYEWIDTPLDDPYWEKTSIAHRYEELDVPAYHLGGWYDCFIGPTLKNFTEMQKNAKTERARKNQKLIVGPWAHGIFTPVIAERSFGVQASGDWINLQGDITSLHLRWFDHWLKGIENQIMEEPPVKIFVMGVNQWRDEQEWPLARTEYVPYYLHSGGKANSRHGDGRLSTSKPGLEDTDQFVYDPGNPVPTRGGSTLYAGVLTMGPRDQGGVEDRDDVLVYTTEPLTSPVEVTGPIKVKLWASTDAEDTDFTAKLVDVLPDGTAFNLADGIIRAKYRNGYTVDHIKPNEIVEYEIDLWATSNVFLPGHSIRVEVSSSNFPRFDRNPNTGGTMVESAEWKSARQTIYHDKDHPSYILLPVIPN